MYAIRSYYGFGCRENGSRFPFFWRKTMADKDGLKIAKSYGVDVPFANQTSFYVKGAGSLDWGMKKHLSNIFA